MYVVTVEGEREQVVDLSGLYRLLARCNPLDDVPMMLDAAAVTKQMTCPKDECLLPVTTREALHGLVWGAAAGKVTTHRFVEGPAIAVRVQPGTEYKQPAKEYGQVKPPAGSRAPAGVGAGRSAPSGSGRHSTGVDEHERRFGVGGRR
jgi:hypothetical protein